MNWFDWFKGANADLRDYQVSTATRRRLIIEEGTLQGLNGAECWENPYVSDNDDPADSQCWHAGWCRGRQQRAKNG